MTGIDIPDWIDTAGAKPVESPVEKQTKPRWYVVVQSNHVSSYGRPYRRLHYADSIEEIHEMYPAPNYEIVEIFLMVASRKPSISNRHSEEYSPGIPVRYAFDQDVTRPMTPAPRPEGF